MRSRFRFGTSALSLLALATSVSIHLAVGAAFTVRPLPSNIVPHGVKALQSHSLGSSQAFDQNVEREPKDKGRQLKQPNVVSARQARILVPLASLAPLAIQPVVTAAAPSYMEDPTFYSSLKKYFSGAVPSTQLADRVLTILEGREFAPGSVLVGSSLCSEGGEAKNERSILYERIIAGLGTEGTVPSGVVSLGGIAGIPFAGPAGFESFFSFSPKSGKVVIVYGPTVGVTEDGIVGGLKSDRTLTSSWGSCNAIMESYKALLSSDGEDNEPSPMGMNANTLQQSYLNKELRKRMSNADLISDDINQVISNIVYTIFGIISDKLTSEVNNLLRSKGSSFWDNVTEITMLGGITVAPLGRNNFGQYFKPIIFQSMTKTPGQTFVMTDNLLGELVGTTPATSTEDRGSVSKANNITNGAELADLPLSELLGGVSIDTIKGASAIFGASAVFAGLKSLLENNTEKGEVRMEVDAKAPPVYPPPPPVPQPAASAKSQPNQAKVKKPPFFNNSFFGFGDKFAKENPTMTKGAGGTRPIGRPKLGVPRLSNWIQNDDGSISGDVSGSRVFSDGTFITTSPLREEALNGAVVQTTSGSQYYLDPRPQTVNEEISMPPPAARPASNNQMQAVSLVSKLFSAASASERGQLATQSQKSTIVSIVAQLEDLSPITSPTESTNIEGTWELVYTNTQLFRANPFFLARRALCSNIAEISQYRSSCGNLQRVIAYGSVGKVRQIIGQGRLVSEINLISGALESVIFSEAYAQPAISGTAWDLSLISAEVRGSNVPVVRQLLEIRNCGGFPLSLGSTALFETTYLDDTLRISKDEDGNFFIFEKVSASTIAANYSATDGRDVGLRII